MTAYQDAVIEALSASEAALREQVADLVDQLADLAIQNAALRVLAARELTGRVRAQARRRSRRVFLQHN